MGAVRLPLTIALYEAAMDAADRAAPEGCTCDGDAAGGGEAACPWHAEYLALVEEWREARDRAENNTGKPFATGGRDGYDN